MHLSPEFGLTYRQIEQDGFTINKKVEMLLSSDTSVGISKSMGLAHFGYADAFEELNPDIIVLLGDRFEILPAASCALVAGIPVAHIHGGEITTGAFDDAIRHSITQMSHLHFTSTEEYRQRVIQLGEHPDRVFNVGALGIENIWRLKLLSKKELEKRIGFELGERCILVTFHPVTLDENSAEKQFSNLLDAITDVEELRIIFTKSNADIGGRIINQMIDNYVSQNRNSAIAFTSMSQTLYLSAMKHVDAVVGNSSSGIIEAPSMLVPTVNIGDRQKGRIRAASVIDSSQSKKSVATALGKGLSYNFKQSIKNIKNPYEKKNTAKEIKRKLKICDLGKIIKKQFYNFNLPI
jgi:GDP/UDP-N,N'-diacetylbacillosamine 2-epimerase (hydrolysing)